MPPKTYKKKYYKKRGKNTKRAKARKFKNKKFRQGNTVVKSQIFDKATYVKLPYVLEGTFLSASLGVPNAYQINLNSVYDPDYTLGG